MKDIVQHNCEICRLGMDKWDLRTNQSRNEIGLFKVESDVIRSSFKHKQFSSFMEIDGIYYDQGRLSVEFPFKTQDLDQFTFLDKQEKVGMKPLVLEDSPVLHAFVMFVQTKSSLMPGLNAS